MKRIKLSDRILYEDDHMVILDKPPKLLSVPDRFNSNLPSIKSILRKHYGEIFVLHRLDFGTSGVICYGKHAEVQRVFTKMQEENQVEKYYHALCEGYLAHQEGIIDEPLYYSGGKTFIAKKEKGSKPSTTIYKNLKSYGSAYHLMECQLISGRTHQIRAHLSHIHLPLAVDSLYGHQDGFYLSKIKRKYKRKSEEEERPLIDRITLHAVKIKFDHPITGESMEVEAEYPKDLRALIKQLDKLLGA